MPVIDLILEQNKHWQKSTLWKYTQMRFSMVDKKIRRLISLQRLKNFEKKSEGLTTTVKALFSKFS